MQVIRRYWSAVEGRDWGALAHLLAVDVVYEIPQTRERVTGRDPYIRINAEYPGDWHLTVEQLYEDSEGGASWTTFRVDDATMPGLTFFRFGSDNRIERITDFWPEPYGPPPGREHLVRRF